MSVALIADAHLGGPGGDGEDLIVQLLALPRQGCRHLVLLGDLFHVWIGDRRYETEEIRCVCRTLSELRRHGIRVSYVEGNRDFFLDAGPYAEAFDQLAQELVFESGGKKYLAVHGDGLNEKDRRYRFWRWLSKSRPARFLIFRIPRRLARAIVDRTERRLARTNFKHKARIPEQAIRRYAEGRLAEGVDEVLLGHFHEARCFEVAGGEVRVLDAWFRCRRVEWLPENAPSAEGSVAAVGGE